MISILREIETTQHEQKVGHFLPMTFTAIFEPFSYIACHVGDP